MHELLGRNLSPDEHDTLREIINTRIETETEWLKTMQNLQRREHKLICSECAKSKTVFGGREIRNAYKGKRRGFVAN